MSNNKSLFLITFGPAGSGKGYIMPNLLTHIANVHPNIKNIGELKYARIDDFVEVDRMYVENSLALVPTNILSDPSFTSYLQDLVDIKASETEINRNLSNIATQQFSGNFRKLETLADKYYETYTTSRKTYDKTLDDNLIMWLKSRNNIVFETTGQSNFNWLFSFTPLKNEQVLNDYIIILVYPYVASETILARALNRFIVRVDDSIKLGKFTKDTTSHTPEFTRYVENVEYGNRIGNKKVEPPRLPKLLTGEYSLYKSITAIQNTIANYIGECLDTNTSKIDTIMLYDNTKTSPILTVGIKCREMTKLSEQCNDLTSLYEQYGKTFTAQLLEAIENVVRQCPGQKGSSYKASRERLHPKARYQLLPKRDQLLPKRNNK